MNVCVEWKIVREMSVATTHTHQQSAVDDENPFGLDLRTSGN